jgi:ribosomal protein S18 acetylase RimI-like enzyme
LRIRKARITDLGSLKALFTELLDTVENQADFNVDSAIINCYKLLKDPGSYLFVAVDDKAIRGFINFTTRKTIMHHRPSGLIDELIVAKSARGSGVGTRLIAKAVQQCRRMGCSEVEVSTEKSNTNARRFYKTCGFGEVAVLLEFELGE